MSIFADNAENYWKRGLPAIPLIPQEKRPAIRAWQRFATEMPDEQERQVWLQNFPNGNIGMPMGPCSGLVAIDIDCDDAAVLRVLNTVLPPSPWTRRGKKGEVRVYRFKGESSTRLKTSYQMICELLSAGTQIVLPPSIHPDTKAAYQANVPLWEIVAAVPDLPMNAIEIIRSMLIDEGYDISRSGSSIGKGTLNFVASGQRDSTMVSLAGLLARGVLNGERTLKEAMGEMETWVENYVEQVAGDELSLDKARRSIVRFLLRDVEGPLRKVLPANWDEDLTHEDKVALGVDHFGDEERLWSKSELLEWFVTEMAICGPPGSDGHSNAIMKLLGRIARMEGKLGPLDEEHLLKVVVTHSAKLFTMATLRKQIRDMRQGALEGDNHDEIARAVLEHMGEYGEIRFSGGRFWRWGGANWEELPESEIMRTVSGDFGNLPACRKQNDYAAIVRLMRDLAAKDLIQVAFRGVNFANGFLTEDLDLREHNPDFGQTYVLPYRYMPELAGNMPLFNSFMSDSWSHDGKDFDLKVAALQEFIGATLFGVAPQFQRVICLFGQPGSGKSVMSQIVRDMLPVESQSSIPPQDWNDKFLPAELYGKVLNFAGELSESRLIAGDIFKRISEGSELTAQFKNKTPFTFKPKAAHWFNSNHLPKTADPSMGFYRRWLFLEWTKAVSPDKVNPNLASDISDTEREAIVSWAVLGFVRLIEQNGYTLPESHKKLVDQTVRNNNSVFDFLANCPRVKKVKNKETSITELYGEYMSFTIATGIAKRVSTSAFATMLKELRDRFEFDTLVKPARGGSMEEVAVGLAVDK